MSEVTQAPTGDPFCQVHGWGFCECWRFTQQWPMWQPAPSTGIACVHCFCRDAPDAGAQEGPHAECCKCFTKLAKRFLP